MATALRTLAVQVAMNSAQFRKDVDRVDRRFRRMSSNMRRSAHSASAGISALGGVFAGVFGGRILAQSADVMVDLRNKMQSVTESTSDMAFAMAEVRRIAKESRADIEAVGTLYQRLIVATKSLGFTLKDVSSSVQVVTDTFLLSGTTAQEAANSARQFAQGLASGAIKGDEFRSISENNVVLMNLLAEGLNMTVGELKEFASRGGLTAERVLPILQKALIKTREKVGDMAVTLSQGSTLMKNSFINMVDRINQRYGIVTKAAEVMVMLADNMGKVAMIATAVLLPALLRLAVVGIVKVLAFSFAWVPMLGQMALNIGRVGLGIAKLGPALLTFFVTPVGAGVAAVAGLAAGLYVLEDQWRLITKAWKLGAPWIKAYVGFYADIATHLWDAVAAAGKWLAAQGKVIAKVSGKKDMFESQLGGVGGQGSNEENEPKDPSPIIETITNRIQGMMASAKESLSGLIATFTGEDGQAIFTKLGSDFTMFIQGVLTDMGVSLPAIKEFMDILNGGSQEAEDKKTIADRMNESEALKPSGILAKIQAISAAFIGMGNDGNSAFGAMKSSLETYGDVLERGAQQSKKVAAIKKALLLREAIMTQQVAIMNAWKSAPFPYNLAAVAITAAQTALLIREISGGGGSTAGMGAQVSGQAHDGIDNIPSTGTYLLEKGERVVDSRLNKDLSGFLANGMQGSQSSSEVNLNLTGVSDPDLVINALRERRGELEAIVRRISADHAREGVF